MSFFKFAFLALGEILLLFIGIFLALQAENWNEAKKEKELETFSLHALYDEMKLNDIDLKKAIHYHKRAKEALAILMTISPENCSAFPNHYLDSLLAEAQWAWTFNPRMGVVKSIISTGQIKNVQNPALRMFITSFEDITNDSQEESLVNNKLITDQYIPLVNQYVGEGNRGKYLGFPLKESRFKSNYKKLFTKREFESLIAYMYVWRVDQESEETELNNQIEKGLKILEQEVSPH